MTPRVLLVAGALLAVAACGGSPAEMAAPLTPAPPTIAEAADDLPAATDFTLSTFNGDTFRLSDHFGELPVVLNFWAPW